MKKTHTPEQDGGWMTRAELLRHGAGEAVEELRRYGGWKGLDEEAPMRPLAKG
jgi:hypothetical protein